MKQIFRKNQIVITALAVVIAIAGYLTYAGKDSARFKIGQAAEAVSAEAQKEAEEVRADPVAAESVYSATVYAETVTNSESSPAAPGVKTSQASDTEATQASAQSSSLPSQLEDSARSDLDSLDYDIENAGEAVLANGMTVSDYAAMAKLTREQIRGKNREELQNIIDDEQAEAVNKQAAVDQMVSLTEKSEKECAAETMLSAKGFDNSIVTIADSQVDVVICQDTLSDAELAQVEDIVKRKTGVVASAIVISLADMEK